MPARKGRIDKAILEPLVEGRLSTRDIAKQLQRGPTSVRYWLKVYGLKTEPDYHERLLETPPKCSCGETDPQKFYGNKHSVCGECHNQYTLRAGQVKKARAREYLGGKCTLCGFDKYQSALDVHHPNPAVKDSKFHQMRGWSWERIVKEISGCVLLCSNCHGALHAGEIENKSLYRTVG